MKETSKAHLALLGANLFYGAGFSIAKTIMPSLIAPAGFIFIRVMLAALLFWLSFFGGTNFRTKIATKDWVRLAGCGLFGVAANQLLFFQGLNLTSPIHASLMMLSTPILVGIFVTIAYKEKFSLVHLIGLCLGISGALLLIIFSAKNTIASNPSLGNLLVFLNATSYALYLVMVKPLMKKYRPIIVIRWIFLIGFVFVFPFGYTDFISIQWSMFQTADFVSLGFIVVGVTFFTYLWNIYAIKILSPSIAGAYIYLQPLFAAIIAMIFLNESLDFIKIMAALLIVAGVYLVSKKKTA